VHPITQAATGTSSSSVGPAVLMVGAVVAIWWLAAHGKGEAKLRFISWLLLPVIVWLLMAAQNPAEAGRVATGAASGAGAAISAIGRLFSGA
jgi:hypothetical protein